MQKPTMSLGHKIPLHPWTKLATDLFHFKGASYLLIVDYTRRFFGGVQAIFHDWTACFKPVQACIFWIWLARNFNFWQWTLLHCGCFYQCNECISCQSYQKLTPLPTIQWTCWKVCTDCEKLILQNKRRVKRFIQVFNDILQDTP